MNQLISFALKQSKRILAVGIIIGLFWLAQLPVLSKPEKLRMAEHFAFSRFPLPEINTGAIRQERTVNPH
ncbi:MAG: hypothetical protein VKL42_07280, partial [Snowella sp.]|nr:hypothetical protein [Snowella sp.]